MPNLFLHSINIYVADGTTSEWDFNFDGVNPDDNSGTTPYLHPDDVKVQVIHTAADGSTVVEQRDRQLIAPNRVLVLGPQIPAGSEVRVYRETENRYPLVDYRDMQTVGSADLDLHARQTLFVAMEAIDVATLAEQASARAEGVAGEANATAEEARTIAEEARTTASAANATADAANATSQDARDRAQSAVDLATEAKEDAEAVRGLAEQAGNDAASAADSAAQAEADAATAVSVAGAVDGKAQQALDNSVVAGNNAAQALSTANAIDSKATQALSDSSAALDAATTALSTANAIDGKAQQALDDSATAASTANTALSTANAVNSELGNVVYKDALGDTSVGTLPIVSPVPVEDNDPLAEALAKLQAQVQTGEILSVEFFPGNRSTLAAARPGKVAADGMLLSRAAWPQAWAFIQAFYTVVSDEDWLNTSLGLYGHFSSGDGSTTFRMPDWNGVMPGHKRRVPRGTSEDGGGLTEDALQNITGHFRGPRPDTATIAVADENSVGGAFRPGAPLSLPYTPFYTTPGNGRALEFDASRVARTADETRPASIDGIWIMRLGTGVVNGSQVDMLELASDLSALASDIAVLSSSLEEARSAINRVPELLWSGNVGNVDIPLTLAQPIEEGDLLFLRHTNSQATVSMLLAAMEVNMVAGRKWGWSFGSTGVTELTFNSTTQFTASFFTSGYGVSGLYRIKRGI